MSLLRDAVSLLATRAAVVPIALAQSVVLARGLSIESRGQLGVLATFATLATLVGGFGWQTAAIHRIRRGADADAMLGATLGVAGIAALLAVLAGALLWPGLADRLFAETPARAYALVIAALPFQLLGQYLIGVARGLDAFSLGNRYLLATAALSLVAGAGVLFGLGAGLEALLLAFLAVHAVTSIWLFAALVRRTGLPSRMPTAEVVSSLRFAARSWLVSVTGQLHERIDVFMLAALAGGHAPVAVYVIALGIVERLRVIPEAVSSALFPDLAARQAADAAERTARVSRHGMAWVAGAAGTLAIASPWLVPLLYGDAYRDAVLPCLLLLPAVVAHTTHRLLSRFFLAVEQHGIPLGVQLGAVGLNVGLNLWLIPRWGAAGAAAASLVSYSGAALATAWAFARATGHGPLRVLLLRRSDLADYDLRPRRGSDAD